MPTCLTCSREIPAGSAFCAHCGSPNPEATPGEAGDAAASDVEALRGRLQAALGPALVVEEEVGEGGFSVVFAVMDRRLSRRIAVKVLRPELTAGRSSKQRFVREAEAAAKLNHPHILPIFFVGEGQGLVYFGMPLADGETLDARLRREGRLSEVEVTRLGGEIADALAEAHAQGLVHRDIKPQNVMLQGTKRHALVADFGIAKAAAGGSGEGEKLTGTGVIIGSPHYMSPEQASGEADIDHRSDLYSVGILLWQMMVGEVPFESDRSQAVLMKQVTRPVPPLRTRRADASAAMEAVVARCTEKERERRFQSAEELSQALRALATAPAATSPRRDIALKTAAALGVLATALLGWVMLQGRPGAVSRSASRVPVAAARSDSAGATAAAPVATSPVIAVLPFSVVTSGDTAQFSRSAALMFAEALALRNAVQTVDANALLGRWIAEGRRTTAPLDSNARFAYGLGANQVVVGTYVESGRQFRLAVNMYDTHDAASLWRDEVTGPMDSLFQLVDRLASRAAQSLCSQPDYNPGALCFDTPARAAAPLAVTAGAADTALPPIAFLARVSPSGQMTDVRLARPASDDALTSRALDALRSASFVPARKAGRAVDGWASVAVAVRPAGAAELALRAECADPAFGVRNPERACFDSRPVPQSALPEIAAPALCRGSPSPATILVRVTAGGAVEGAPALRSPSDCAAFNTAAVTAAAAIGFVPARKEGRPVPAWTLLLVRAAPGAAGTGRT